MKIKNGNGFLDIGVIDCQYSFCLNNYLKYIYIKTQNSQFISHE